MKRPLKRPIPSESDVEWRSSYLEDMRNLVPLPTNSSCIKGLEQGNNKTGKHGRKFKKVYVWNLPPVVTCPGATKWCLKYCYNADLRFPIEKWQKNWCDFLSNQHGLKKRINEQLKNITSKCAVRIHSSGDFFSGEYIKFWISIVKDNPHISFWAYTRSWRCKSLVALLCDLNTEHNVQIFASLDPSIKEKPPHGWRTAVIDHYENIGKYEGIFCPEQVSYLIKCSTCGVCIQARKDNVIFVPH